MSDIWLRDSSWGETLKYIRNIMSVIQKTNDVIIGVHLLWEIIMKVMIILNSIIDVMYISIDCNILDVL